VLVALALRGFRSVARDAEVAREHASQTATAAGTRGGDAWGVNPPGGDAWAANLPGGNPPGARPPGGRQSNGRPTGATTRSARRTYVAFLGLTLLNPMTVTYFAALILGLGGTGTDPVEKIAFVAGALGASLSWQTLIAAVGAALHRRLAPRLRLAVGIVGNLIVLAFAAIIVVGLVR
jgi:arginine exporter protein ArgO